MVGAVLSLFLFVTKELYGKERERSRWQIKTCRKKQHVKIDDRKEMPDLICGKTAVGGNYNLTRDSIAVKIKKSAGALKHRRTFALLFCQSKNQTITESDAPRGSQHQQAPEL